MKVKFCGMTNLDDVLHAVELGVDLVGFVFYEKSKRYISYKKAKEIIDSIDKKDIKTVGVFVDQSDDEIRKAFEFCGLDYAQVYRDINNISTIRVYRIKNKLPESVVNGLVLFDSYTKSIGGSGISFDLDIIKDIEYKDRLIVAGGVSIDNIESIARYNVFGVDLVSSIEAYPGKKSIEKMEDFMRVLRSLKDE